MIFDCAIYAGEAALLEISVNEFKHLSPLKLTMPVTHVFVESRFTFTGIEKGISIHPPEWESYPIEWGYMNTPPNKDPWINETLQRNMLKTLIQEMNPSDDDIVIIRDIDECPRAYAIQHYRPEFGLCALQMDLYYYYLNCRAEQAAWRIPKIMTWEYLKDKTPDQVRRSGYNLALVEAGWHFSYMGGVESMLNKFKSFSHQEEGVQRLANREVLQGKIDRLESLWSDNKYGIVNNEDLPWYVQQHQEEFKSMLYGQK